MSEAMKQAEAGMALFAKDSQEEAKLDVPGAEAFKQEQEAAIKVKEEEANALTGKDNKKARTEISKQVAAMKVDPKYIDACKVVKGLAPPSGNFQVAGAPKMDAKAAPVASAPAAAEAVAGAQDSKKAKDAKPKKVESAGLSKAERDELEKLKADIIARKSELKAAGKTGGECNKDEQVVAWVARMNELKIKEDPSLAAAGKEGKDAGKAKKEGWQPELCAAGELGEDEGGSRGVPFAARQGVWLFEEGHRSRPGLCGQEEGHPGDGGWQVNMFAKWSWRTSSARMPSTQ